MPPPFCPKVASHPFLFYFILFFQFNFLMFLIILVLLLLFFNLSVWTHADFLMVLT
jgi:hypothetical protein